MTSEMYNSEFLKTESTELLKCVFCNSPDTNLILFTVEKLKKCHVILGHRKEHNLKYKDVILSVDLYDNGYHRQCYKLFTSLPKKYYNPKCESVETSYLKVELQNTRVFTSCLSRSELDVQSTEEESLDDSNTSPETDPIPDSNIKLEPSIIPEVLWVVEPDQASPIKEFTDQEMADLAKCVFCNNPDTKLILFTVDTFNKCKVILGHRKEHNLKYKDVILPVDLYDSGYHRQCYKLFTSLPKKYYEPKCESVETSNLKEELQNITHLSTSCLSTSTLDVQTSQEESLDDSIPRLASASILEMDPKNVICIFCDKKYKKKHSKTLSLHCSIKENFLSKINQDNINNTELNNKIVSYPGSKIYYHKTCKLTFGYKVGSSKKTTKTYWHDLRDRHQNAYKEVTAFIQKNIIENGECYYLTYLYKYYMEFMEFGEDNSKENKGKYKVQHLEDKIKKTFNKQVKFFLYQNKKVLARKDIPDVGKQSFEHIKDEDIVNKAALLLRESILKIEKKKLSQHNISMQNSQGESFVPQELLGFLTTLIAGNSRKRKNDPNCMRQIHSYSEDIVNAVLDKKVKISKLNNAQNIFEEFNEEYCNLNTENTNFLTV